MLLSVALLLYYWIYIGDYMSKKHYISIARVLSENKAPFQLCSDMAVQFKNDNRLFDINRFLSACGH